MTTIQLDELRNVLADLSHWCSSNGLLMVRGHIDDPTEARLVAWLDPIEPRGWQEFVSLAKLSCATFVTVSVTELLREDLDELVRDAEELTDPVDRDDRLIRVRRHEDRVGHVMMLELASVAMERDAMVIRMEIGTEWQTELFPLYQVEEEDEEELDEGDDEDDGLADAGEDEDDDSIDYDDPDDDHEPPGAAGAPSNELIEELARRVAADSRFQRASRSDGSDFFAAQDALDKDADLVPRRLDWVVQRARAIWKLDIEPEQTETLRKKALELLSQNFKRYEIAAQLGITGKRLKELIG